MTSMKEGKKSPSYDKTDDRVDGRDAPRGDENSAQEVTIYVDREQIDTI
jgi:hypothetical protein